MKREVPYIGMIKLNTASKSAIYYMCKVYKQLWYKSIEEFTPFEYPGGKVKK